LIPNLVGGERLLVMKVVSGDESFPEVQVHTHATPSAEVGDHLKQLVRPAQMTVPGLDRPRHGPYPRQGVRRRCLF
jgi:hypothetical protein